MKTDAQRARDARKRKKARAHKAAQNPNSPYCEEWPFVDIPEGDNLYEFLVFGNKASIPESIAYDLPADPVDDDVGLHCPVHAWFRLPYKAAARLGMYWFLRIPKDAAQPSDDQLKKMVCQEIESTLGFNKHDMVVFIVGRP
jgi:hypothetical protein